MLGRHVLRGKNMPGRNVCAVLLSVMKMLGRHFFSVALGVTTNILGRHVSNVLAVLLCVTNMPGRQLLAVALRVCFCRDLSFRFQFFV